MTPDPLPSQRPICFLTYATPPVRLDPAVVVDRLGPSLTGRMTTAGPAGLLMPMPSGPVAAMLVPEPLSAGMVSDDVAQRLAWPDWQVAHAGWRGHAVISTLGRIGTAAARRMAAADVLRAAAAIAATTGADGASWSGSQLVVSAAALVDGVRAARLPVELLVRVLWRGRERPLGAGLAADTRGLSLFGLPEVAHAASGDGAGEIHDRVLALAAYLLEGGAPIRDGEMISLGRPARVTHRRDDDGQPVLTVSCPDEGYDPGA